MNEQFDANIDYFALLGVAYDAQADEVKKGYRKMARRYHPDVSTLSDAQSRFQDVANAYEILTKYREAYLRARKVLLTTREWERQRQEREKAKQQQASQARRSYEQMRAEYERTHSGRDYAQTRSTQQTTDNRYGRNTGQSESFTERRSTQSQDAQSYRSHQPQQQSQSQSSHAKQSESASSDTTFNRRLAPINGKDREVHYPLTLRYAIRLLKAGVFHIPGLNIKMRFTRTAFLGKRFRLKGRGYKGLFGGESGDFYVSFDIKTKTDRFTLIDADIHAVYQVPHVLLKPGHKLSLDSPGGMLEWIVDAQMLEQQPVRFKGWGLPAEGTLPAGDLLAHIKSY